MKTTLICVTLLAFRCWAVAGQEASGVVLTNNGDYEAAFKKGVTEAEKELKAGKATLYVYGTRDDYEFLDRKTGLPCEVIGGCVVNQEIAGRAAGHNGIIEEFIAKEGLPSNSFKRWEKALFNLRAYYEWRTKSERPFRLTANGSAVKSDDGKYAIRLGKRQVKEKDGTLKDELFVVIRVAEVDHEASKVWPQGTVDFIWGPKGSGFAVFHCERDLTSFFTPLDLKRRTGLRREY